MTTKPFKKIAFLKLIAQKTLDNTELQFAHTAVNMRIFFYSMQGYFALPG